MDTNLQKLWAAVRKDPLNLELLEKYVFAVRRRSPRYLTEDEIRDATGPIYFHEEEYENVIYRPPDWPIETAEEVEQEGWSTGEHLYAYAAVRTVPDDHEIETLWIAMKRLVSCPILTENEARIIHPALFGYLDQVNRGEV